MRNILLKLRLKIKSIKRPKFSTWAPLFALIILTLFLCFKSYTPNTFLTGWDTLHPEFNFSHALQSIFWGVWRSDQGLGAIAAHSHMSELPRVLYLFIVSKFLSLSFLRYSYVFLCLILGTLGMFFFLRKFIKRSESVVFTDLASLVGASYYLLNLGTVQRFSVPFEMFTTQFASLPWVFLFAFSFLEKGSKKILGLLAIVSFFGSSQAYAATLFYAYALLFGMTIVFYTLQNRKKRGSTKKALIILFTLFATNAYWFLPNLYSVASQSHEVSNAHINQLFTPEAVIHNRASGNFLNVISQKNYLFSWAAYDFSSGKFADLLATWNAHLSDSRVSAIPLVFAFLAFLGLGVVIYKRQRTGLAFMIPTFVSLFFLMNSNGPLGSVYSFLQTHSGLFGEGFRDPFTKFSTIFSFFMSYYIAIFLLFLYSQIQKIKKLLVVPFLITLLLVTSLGILMKPAFQNGLISPLMRVNIPTEYFEAFKYFDGKVGRIAQLPLNSLWGWQYNAWGYQGAGFFWFGIRNPYLTRDFDRWSANNETFYNEISRAFYASDVTLFESVIQKYNVSYLLLDGSIFDPGSESKNLSKEAKAFLSKIPSIKIIKTFGFIDVYQTSVKGTSFDTPSLYSKINAVSTYSPVDYTYAQYGDYVSSENGAWKPFVNFDSRIITQKTSDNWMTLSATSKNVTSQTLTIPDVVKREDVLPVNVSISRSKTAILVKFDLIQPKIVVDGVSISTDPVYLTTKLKSTSKSGFLSVEASVFDISNVSEDSEFHSLGNMYVNSTGKTKLQLFTKESVENSSFLSDIKTKNASWCSDPSKEGGLTKLTRGFVLTSYDQSVCIGSLVTLSSAALYDTSFVSTKGSSSLFCLNQIGKDGCVNVMPPQAVPVFGGRKISYQTPLESGNYWFAFVGQSIPNSETKATYDQIVLSYHPEISRNYVDFGSSYSLFSSERNVPVENGRDISVSYFVGPIISENFLLERGHSIALNCSVPKKGEVSKSFKENTVSFGATNNGVSCDYFDYPQLLQTQAYVMTVKGVNLSGRSSKFYVQNVATSRMDREELLPAGDFTSGYVLEPYAKGEGGYVINLETRAFDSFASKNTFSEISFSPIPLKWLTEIAIGPKTAITTNNNLKIEEVSTTGTLSKIKTTGTGMFSLNESYQGGWFAITSKGKVLKHVVVNGWKNGWEVPYEVSTIYVFYAPQLLEFIGMLLGIFLAYSLIRVRKDAIVFELTKLSGNKKSP